MPDPFRTTVEGFWAHPAKARSRASSTRYAKARPCASIARP